MPDLQPDDQKVRYKNVAELNVEYENGGFTPDTTSGVYEFTLGGYEELKRIENISNRAQKEEQGVDGSVIYDTGHKPSRTTAGATGINGNTPGGYEERKMVENNKSENSFQNEDDPLNEDNLIIYDVGYEPASSHSTMPGMSVMSSAQ